MLYKAFIYKANFISLIFSFFSFIFIHQYYFFTFNYIYCFFFLFQYFFNLLFLHYLGIRLLILEITNITEDEKITEKVTSIFDSILLVLVVKISYIMAMPYSRISKTLFFKSSNITNLFNWYKLIYINFQLKKREKIWKLLLYFKMFIDKYIESIIRLSKINWSAIHKAL